MKYLLLAFALVIQFCHAEMRVGNLNQNNDQGIWLEQNIHITFNESWSLLLNTNERWGDDYRRLWYFRQWSILQYDLTKHLKTWFCIPENSIFTSFTLGPGFSKVWSIRRNTRGFLHWENSNRPNFAAFMTHSWRDWVMQQRMVGEYIDYVTKHYHAHAFYRHRVKLNSPWKWSCHNINPFISNEWFFRSEDEDADTNQSGPFYEDRLRIGIAFDIIKHFSAEAWWQLRLTKQQPGSNPLWRKTYQLGLSLNLNF